jgi:hypothetical protein
MECTVTGNIVVASEDGKFKTYSGLKGGVEANEKLKLNYRATSNGFYIELVSVKEGKDVIINSYQSIDDPKVDSSRGANGGIILTNTERRHGISFLPDYIRIAVFDVLYLSRYYKNDWHGIYSNVQGPDSYANIFTLNCRHVNDKMDVAQKIFNAYKIK